MGRKRPRRQPGYRFHPTDVELVVFYLKKKVTNRIFRPREIAEVNIYKFAPWKLPEKSISKSSDLKWYFFCPVEKKYANGLKMNRSTELGHWKSTGNCKSVLHNDVPVGSRKTLIFYGSSGEQSGRTNWVMHEYNLEYKNLAKEKDVRKTYVLCKIFQKCDQGPRIGDEYGAPYNEADWKGWSDDEVVDNAEVAASSTQTSLPPPNNNSNSAAIGTTSLDVTTIAIQRQLASHHSDVPHSNKSSECYEASGDNIPPAKPAYSHAEGNTTISSGDERYKSLGHEEDDAAIFGGLTSIVDNWDDFVRSANSLYYSEEVAKHRLARWEYHRVI